MSGQNSPRIISFSLRIRSRSYILLFVTLISAIQLTPLRTGYAFSKGSYITELSLPSVALVYSRVDYEATLYIPWTSGTEPYTVTHYIAAIGSGFFVNPNGYLVTNGHVVFCFSKKNYAEDSITKGYILQDAVITLIDWYQQQYGRTFTQGDVQIITDYNVENAEIRDTLRSTYVILGEADGDVIEAKRGISATVVNSDPFLGRDLAILKVELSDAPSLLIGDSDSVKTGDSVYAFGYPGVATFHPQLSSATFLEPSVTQGVVSAKRLTQQDIAAIQHSASTTHGNSGGPLLDENGTVVGVNNMGSISELGLEVAGFNFAVASNVLKDFLRENGVANSVGDVTTQYKKGLAYYYAKMYESAKKQFDAVTTLFPYQWRAKQLSQECQSAITRGESAESSVALSAVPLTVKVKKEAITVNGVLQHASEMPIAVDFSWPATQVTVQYTRPDGSSVTHIVLNSKDGAFSDTLTPDASGQWSVKASWEGNGDHKGAVSNALAFTVTEPSLIETLTDTGMIYVIPVVVVAMVAVVFLMRRRRAGGPLPPPPP